MEFWKKLFGAQEPPADKRSRPSLEADLKAAVASERPHHWVCVDGVPQGFGAEFAYPAEWKLEYDRNETVYIIPNTSKKIPSGQNVFRSPEISYMRKVGGGSRFETLLADTVKGLSGARREFQLHEKFEFKDNNTVFLCIHCSHQRDVGQYSTIMVYRVSANDLYTCVVEGLETDLYESWPDLIRVVGVLRIQSAAPLSLNPQDFIDAAYRGDAAAVQALIEAGVDINAKNKGGMTALWLASQGGHTAVVETLLARGADVNVKADNGATALTQASQEGHLAIVLALLDKGADVSGATLYPHKGLTPLILAGIFGHTRVVEALLKKGADVNVRAGNGMTPVMFASEAGHPDVVQALLARGADLNHTDVKGRTALKIAKKAEVIALLERAGTKAMGGPEPPGAGQPRTERTAMKPVAMLLQTTPPRMIKIGETLESMKAAIGEPDVEQTEGNQQVYGYKSGRAFKVPTYLTFVEGVLTEIGDLVIVKS
jgi:uncharacterized protein